MVSEDLPRECYKLSLTMKYCSPNQVFFNTDWKYSAIMFLLPLPFWNAILPLRIW